MKSFCRMLPLVVLLLTSGPALASNTDYANQALFSPARKVQIYFGEKYEPLTHFGIHFVIATWRPRDSLIAAISIETADALGGRFELRDWTFRLSGCLAGYLVKRFIFGLNEKRKRNQGTAPQPETLVYLSRRPEAISAI